ncbi:hypothetical protein ACX1C1_05295 [Paenibacillus sp. strain BS8-2]
MQQIEIKQRYPMDPDIHPSDTDYPQIAFLIEPQFAVVSEGFEVNLVKVVPDDQFPAAYKMADDWDSFISIGIDDKRTVAGLAEIVERLKTISAYDMLTRHFNYGYLGPTFYVNRDNTFIANYSETVPPVNEQAPPSGGDY